MPSNDRSSMSQDTEVADDSHARTGNKEDQGPPEPVHIWRSSLKHVRREIAWKWCLTTLSIFTAILALLSLYYAALFHASENLVSLVVAVVDFDGQIAPYNTSGTVPIIGPEFISLANTYIEEASALGYIPLTAADFNYDPINVRQAVYDQKYWAAIIINGNATTALQNTIATGDTSFSPLGIAQLVYVEARDQTTWNDYIYPFISQFQTQITSQAGSVWATTALEQASSNATVLANIAAVPSVLSPAIGFSTYNLRPFWPPQVTPTVTVGLIYLIIISFFSFTFYVPIYMKLIKPEGHPPARFWEMTIVRYIGIIASYFFLSLAYTLVGLAFKVNFSTPSIVQSETEVTPYEGGNSIKYGAATFPALWLLNWIGMGALGLACENVTMVVGMPWTSLWLIFWVISNVSTAFYPIEIEAHFFYWGYAWPLHNVVEATRTLLFDTHNRLGLNFGILVAWVAVNTVVFPFASAFMGWKQKKQVTEYWA